jgi:hypothetical protein
MPYDVPGRANSLSAELLGHWNDEITRTFEGMADRHTRFFSIDFEALDAPAAVDTVKWPGDSAEAAFCIDERTAQVLSDWGKEGRHGLHNEYCEYAVVTATEDSGKVRPKRVQVTTELREYWVTIAMHDPDRARELALEVLGVEPPWEDLYGVPDPDPLSPQERKEAFSRQVAGHGNDEELQKRGVPADPEGRLNNESALFMAHPINGLDDLIFIVRFGARPFAKRVDRNHVRASKDEIFATSRPDLACRHADPAAALGAYGAAFVGKQVAFANPLGMYIREPNLDVFRYRGETIPKEWANLGRGNPGMRQRLEFGPRDDDDAFLDEITVSVGATDEPMVGGHQLIRELEVGPLVLVGSGEPVSDDEFIEVNAVDQPIACNEASVCRAIRELKERHDKDEPGPLGLVRTGPREMGPG